MSVLASVQAAAKSGQQNTLLRSIHYPAKKRKRLLLLPTLNGRVPTNKKLDIHKEYIMKISNNLLSAIACVWDNIVSDVYEMCEGDNEIALEFVLDASRLTMSGFSEENNEVSELISEFGYDKVLNALDKKIQLL
jgi:hypothetical protein